MVKQAFGALWQRAPRTLRKTIVAVIGGTIVLLGLALVVLPGPFTLPLLILGFAILGTEFAWAARALERAKVGMEKGAQLTKAGLRRSASVGRGAVQRVRRRR
jgi:hypothetical protein